MLGTVTGIETVEDDPVEFYDTLTQTGQDTWDVVASYGWRPEKMELGFTATRNSDGFEIGPFESLSVLLAEVQAEAKVSGVEPVDLTTEGTEDAEDSLDGDGDQVELTEDHRGRVFLPGTGPIVDRDLADAAGEFLAADIEWKEAGKRRTTAQQALRTTAGLKKDLFSPDPDNSNAVIYHAGGITIRISKTEKEEIKCFSDKEVDAS